MGRSSALLALLLLSGCGGGPLSLLTGGGPNVAANVPITSGEIATNSVGVTDVRTTETTFEASDAQTVTQTSDTNQVRTERVDTIHNDNRQGPNWWQILLFVAAVMLDSPIRWPGQIIAGLRGKRSD